MGGLVVLAQALAVIGGHGDQCVRKPPGVLEIGDHAGELGIHERDLTFAEMAEAVEGRRGLIRGVEIVVVDEQEEGLGCLDQLRSRGLAHYVGGIRLAHLPAGSRSP